MKTAVAFLLLIGPCGLALAAGTVENVVFYSEALDQYKPVQVYLPEGYDPEGDLRYPVIYYLHGANSNSSSDPELIDALDDLIAGGQIEPVIVVKPSGNGCAWGALNGCSWTNSETQGLYEDYIVIDVVAFADAEYMTIPEPDKRAIMGYSMGAFGAMHAALRHPEAYCAVAAHSGYLYFDDLPDEHIGHIEQEQADSGDTPPYEWTVVANETFTCGWFLFSGAFSPNPALPPYYVDFPLDPFANLRPSVWNRWLEHDPARLASDLLPETAPAIYFDCGTYDEWEFYPLNQHFDAHLTSLGIEHEFQSYAGNHWNQIPQRFRVALQFLDDALHDVTAVTDPLAGTVGETLRLSGSNPARRSASVRFAIAEAGRVSLRLFDVSGRLLKTLVDGDLAAGSHSVDWDASWLSSGVYFYRLEAADRSESLKLVLQN